MFKKKEAKVRVLFVEQKNDFVSQIAEYMTNQLYPDRYEVYSAGPEHDIVDCELISAMYQNGEDMRRQVSKDFKDRDYLREDEEYDFVVYLQASTFEEWASKTPWAGKQILAPMRSREEYTATDDLELYNDYLATVEEVRAWVKENLRDPETLGTLVSA